MEKRKMTKSLAFIVIVALMLSILLSIFVTGYHASVASALTMENNGDFYPDYETHADATAAAKELNIQMAEEGTVLLKNNNNALPVAKTERVSVFGTSSDTIQGTAPSGWGAVAVEGQIQSMAQALSEEGYRVNPALESFYAGHTYNANTQGRQEIYKDADANYAGGFTSAVKRSYKEYNDVAFITLTRFLQEGTGAGDHNTVLNGLGIGAEKVAATDKQVHDTKGGDWHEDLATNQDGTETYKHELMMTNEELDLLKYVKSQGFKKIIYLVNAVVPIEYSDLENDDEVDGILMISRPGAVGLKGVANIISGDANPSGKTNQIYAKDFTADPLWQNVGFNNQTNPDQYNITYNKDGSVATSTKEAPDVTNANAVLSKVTYRYSDADGSLKTTRGNIFNFPTTAAASSYDADAAGLFGTDYEEDIYRDYWYYETKAADMNAAGTTGTEGTEWYKDAVVYPFGYGLNYGAKFAYKIDGVKLNDNSVLAEGTTLNAADLASSANSAAKKTSGTVSVTVTNNGTVAGKEAVELYVTAPYDATDAPVEKPFVKLVAFEKTGILQPGASQTVKIDFNFQDLASYDWRGLAGDKGYVMEGGDWVLRAMSSSNTWMEENAADYAAVNFKVDADAYLKLDDFSGEEVGNLFSPENGVFSAVRGVEGNAYQFNESKTAKQSFMSRKDGFGASFPQAPTAEDMTVSKDALNRIAYWHKFQIGEGITNFDQMAYSTRLTGQGMASNDQGDNFYINPTPDNFAGPRYQDGQDVYSKDGKIVAAGTEGAVKIVDGSTDFPWIDDFKAAQASMADWSQAAVGTTEKAEIQLAAMSAASPYGTTEEVASWKSFMDQLSYNEMEWLINRGQKQAIDRIGMKALRGGDNSNDGGGYKWACNGMIASTFNKDISYKQGRLIGNLYLLRGTNNAWWGGSVQTIRTVWAGRNGEFYATDPMLTGFMGMKMTKGTREKGVATCIKHGILNDQQSPRVSAMITWLSEQTLREIYAKPFQMAIQEGTSNFFMGSYANIGTMYNGVNYNFIQGLMRGEWGAEDMSYTTDNHGQVGRYTPADLMGRAGNDDMDTSSKKGFSGTWNDTTETVEYSMADKMPEPADGSNLMSIEDIGQMQWYLARTNATIFINLHSKTQMNYNGVDASAWTAGANKVELTQGAASAATVAGTIDGAEYVKYEVTKGELPEGITLAANGALEGTPVETGKFAVTVTCTADGWVKNTKDVTVSVESGFTVSIASGTAGTAFNSSVIFEDESATLEASGLPTGLSMSNVGDITGTPITPGTYSVEVTATTRTNVFTHTFDLVIGGTATAAEGAVKGITVTDEQIVITYENGFVQTVGKIAGEDGADGADGTTPTVVIGENGNWFINGSDTGVAAQGPKGDTGETGPKGDTGATGPAGAAAEGCSGSIGGTLASVFGLLAVAAVLFFVLKKKEK